MFKEMRKTLWRTVLALVSLVWCVACTEKAPVYPDLEGYWKEERIENAATGESRECNRLFWALQLGVSEVKDLGHNGYGTYLCRYEYDEGASTLRMYDFRNRGDQAEVGDISKLGAFGIPSDDVTFDVVQLDGDRMVLRVGDTTLYFRSF